MSLTASLLLALACARPPAGGSEARGLLGIRYQAIDEGLVVSDVLPGTPADRAGLGTGDLIVAVGGAPVVAGDLDATVRRLSGPPGTPVSLTVRGPLGAEPREVQTALGRREGGPPDREAPGLTRELDQALARGRVGGAEDAARRLARQAGDEDLRLTRTFREQGRANPEAAVAASRVLADARPDDVEMQFLAGEALYRAGGWREAAERLRVVEERRPADVAGEGGWRGDAGGDPLGRSMLAEALYRDGRIEQARRVAEDLARTRSVPELLALVGSPPPPAGETWRSAATPLEDFSLTLLDGTAWRLSAHRGHPVLINFWASWCGPCKLEMPELERLWKEKKDKGFELVAVSVDSATDRAEVERIAARYTMPIAMDDHLNERLGVEALPSNRLIDGSGALRYASQAYSPEAFQRLTDQVDLALAEPPGADTALGQMWTSGQASLVQALPIPGLDDVWVGAGAVLVGQRSGGPVRLEWTAVGLARPASAPSELRASERVVWLDGPVGTTTGRPWVRGFTAEGTSRWLVTTPSPVNDLEVWGGRLWVATDDGVYALDASGAVLARLPQGAQDLAVGDGVIWAVDGEVRLEITDSGVVVAGEYPDGACALSNGAVASRLIRACVAGRFGEAGAVRVVVAREDGVVVGLDGQGRPAFTLNLPARARLAAWDPDGDGRDELLVAVEDRALARVNLLLP